MHAFLMIGQSNMAGRGIIQDVEPIRNGHLHVLRNGRWQPFFVPVNPDRPFAGITLAESFADLYQRDHDAETGLIPCADGGTCLEDWRENGILFDHAVFQTRLAMRTSSIRGILWHQGESDCTETGFRFYRDRLEHFYEALIRATGLGEVPFLAGGLGDFLEARPEEGPYLGEMNRQIESFASSHTYTAFVDASGLPGLSDHLHFTAAAQRELGRRYYAAYRNLESGFSRGFVS